LHLRLLDRDGNPRTNLPYRLQVDEAVYEGKTDGNGSIRHYISPDAKNGELKLKGKDGEETYRLELGWLPPIDQIAGVQARLHNLGLLGPEFSGELDVETRRALLRFQDRNGLECTGELDGATRAKLRGDYQG
jgi:Putative peptidoglycan binding domain